jgi:hypothetical protein
MRARMNSALGITEQGFSADEACRVPWANHTNGGEPKGGTMRRLLRPERRSR